jgi:predicted ribosomally synthesized peptide with nif11-like leader
MEYHLPLLAMSEEQLAALLAKLKDDVGLQEKLKGAADLDAALAIAKEAGFDVSKADWLRYQANQTLELSDEELEGIAGGDRGVMERNSRGVVCTYTQGVRHCWVSKL